MQRHESRRETDECVWNTRLRLRISECKNLPKMDLVGQSDPYCKIIVDDEAVARYQQIVNSIFVLDATAPGSVIPVVLQTDI